MKFEEGQIIKYQSPWEEKTYIGMVTKKISAGYWVLWCDGSYKILQRSLTKYTALI